MAAHQIAKGLASLGRNGDSVLVHMQPHEVAGLQAIAKSQGTELTINPQTGLPEAFNIGNFFSSLLPTIVGAGVSMIPGMQFASYPMLSGILAGAATGALTNKKDPLSGALMGGLGGFGGANLAKSAMGATADQLVKAGVEPSIGAVQSGFNAIPTNIGANMALPPKAAFTGSTGQMGVNMGVTNMTPSITAGVNTAPSLTTINPALQGQIRPDLMAPVSTPSAFDGFSSNLSKAVENVSADPMKFIGQNKANLATTLGGAALSGLEPSDIYGKPIKPSNADRYDPYATLNLSGDTGLRLYAAGGPVSFADGGDTESMIGAGRLPVDLSDIDSKGLAGLLAADPATEANDAARTAYETQLASALQNGRGMGSISDAGINAIRANMGRMDNIGASVLPNTASTAPTALTALDANRTYAAGGSINNFDYQTSGAPSVFPQSEYADNRVGYAEGGMTAGRLSGRPDLQAMFSDPGLQARMPIARLFSMIPNDKFNIQRVAKGGYLDGAGDGMSDSIPATIEGKQPARLADGEFVVPADVVSHLGNGSSKAGAKVLYNMLDKVRTARTGDKKQGKQINPKKFIPA